jgi:hypothetical protein
VSLWLRWVGPGVCKKCMLVNFPGCAKHRTLLTKPYEVVDRQGKTIYAGTLVYPLVCCCCDYLHLGVSANRPWWCLVCACRMPWRGL